MGVKCRQNEEEDSFKDSDYGGGRKKERREGGESRSSTAGLKTYVTVGSQQVKWERKLGKQQNTNFVILK